jgi:hypothetical protein
LFCASTQCSWPVDCHIIQSCPARIHQRLVVLPKRIERIDIGLADAAALFESLEGCSDIAAEQLLMGNRPQVRFQEFSSQPMLTYQQPRMLAPAPIPVKSRLRYAGGATTARAGWPCPFISHQTARRACRCSVPDWMAMDFCFIRIILKANWNHLMRTM